MQKAGDLILSIRAQIPDPAPSNDPNLDGRTFSAETLLRWINDAAKILGSVAPLIQDWSGVATTAGQDVYALPTEVTGVDQVWYDLYPLVRSRELDHIYISKPSGRAFYFAPHAVHSIPRLHIFPTPDRSGGTGSVSSAVSAGATTIPVTFSGWGTASGYAELTDGTDVEIVRYARRTTSALENVLRGQWLTDARAWSGGTSVRELNLMYKCTRLPRPLTSADTPMEVPLILWPVLEVYVMARVREAEQDHGTALQFHQAFLQAANDLGQRYATRGLRHGLQIRPGAGTALLHGRTIVP